MPSQKGGGLIVICVRLGSPKLIARLVQGSLEGALKFSSLNKSPILSKYKIFIFCYEYTFIECLL